MTSSTFIAIVLMAVAASAHSGFLGYSSGYSGPLSAHFAAPAPVAFAASAPVHFAATSPFSVNSYAATSHHTYAASAPHAAFVNYNSGFQPFRGYAAGPSISKFAASGHAPALYGGPLPYDLSSLDYSGWDAPNAVVKFAAPAQSYDGGWDAAANAVVKFAAPVAPFNGGWRSPKTVVKFGPPTTTTTTTTYAAAGVLGGAAPQAYATPFAGPVGW